MISFIKALLKLLVVCALLAAGAIVLQKQGILDIPAFNRLFAANEQLITFYQWTDASGRVQITREPPTDGRPFHSFKGSADLVTSEQLSVSREIKEDPEKPQPKIKVISDHRDELEKQLLTQEVSTQCRWLVGRLFDVAKQAEQDEKYKEKHCEEYRQRLNELSQSRCRSSSNDFTFDGC